MSTREQELKKYSVHKIGEICRDENRTYIVIDEPFRPALVGLDGFSHAQVLWWFDQCEDEVSRATTQFDPPFAAPILGVFALKAPTRPNPIGLSTVRIESVDVDAGIVAISCIDAFDGTPVLDIKAYLPSFDRVDGSRVPDWASDWPIAMPDRGIPLDVVPKE